MHAGGAPSPLLSSALAITQDALTGHWSPVAATPAPVPAAMRDGLEYLSEARRAQILQAELSGHFRIEGQDGHARVMCGGTEICALIRPDGAVFAEQLVWLRNYADLRMDRIPEISVQLGDQASFFGALRSFNPWRHKKTALLVSVVHGLTIQLEMLVKHHCLAPRPSDLASEVMPIIQTPDHSSFPSGHATEGHMLATVLGALWGMPAVDGGDLSLAYRLAHRIAVNRTVAGVHFPVDSAGGAVLGLALGRSLVALGTGGRLAGSRFEIPAGTDPASVGDFDHAQLKTLIAERDAADAAATAAAPVLPLFRRLYQDAAQEWQVPGAGV